MLNQYPVIPRVEISNFLNLSSVYHWLCITSLLTMFVLDVIFHCFSSTTQRHQRCLDVVMSNGAEANNTLESENPTLVAACTSANENEGVCLALIEQGADPNATNKVGVDGVRCMRSNLAWKAKIQVCSRRTWQVFIATTFYAVKKLAVERKPGSHCLGEVDDLNHLGWCAPKRGDQLAPPIVRPSWIEGASLTQ